MVISGKLTQILRANTIKITMGNIPLQTVNQIYIIISKCFTRKMVLLVQKCGFSKV